MRLNRFVAILFALIFLVSASFTFASASAPSEVDGARILEKMDAKSYRTTAGWDLNFRAYFSSGYDKNVQEKPATLVFYLHNDSGKGSDNTAQLSERGMLNQLVSDSADIMYAQSQYIVVAPQCPADKSFTDEEMLTAVNELWQEFFATEILVNKCIVVGVGGGADGAFTFANRFATIVSRIVTVGGTPDKFKTFGALSSGVNMYCFAESSNTAVKELYAYAEAMEEDEFIDVVYTDGDLSASINAALKADEPSVIEWAVKDSYESRYFAVRARCTEAGGKISTSPATVRYGGDCTVLLTVNKGYVIDKFIVNTKEADVAKLIQNDNNKNQYTYKISNVTSDQTLMVELVATPDEGGKSDSVSGIIIALIVVAAVFVIVAVGVFVVSANKKNRR